MPKKNMSPEEKKAWGEKMKAARAAKKAETVLGDPQEITGTEVTVSELQKQIEELKGMIVAGNVPQGPQIAGGTLIGTVDRYIVDPKNYPDPRPRLITEERLARFAFPINYELEWDITSTSYETIDRVRQREPKFTLTLNVIVRDEETDEPTNGRYTIRKWTFHEDPQAAIVVARDNGVDVESFGEKQFLDEMRYLRMRDSLLEAFYPAKMDATKKAKREMVIGNRVVQYFEVSSTDSQKIPFDQLSGKV